MLTIFTIPLPFQGRDAISQRNAILSWTYLQPTPEIILLGDEQGTGEFALRHGLRYIPSVAHTEDGFISTRNMFLDAQQAASNDLLALVDADVVLMDDFMSTVTRFVSNEAFFLVGYRRAIALDRELDFSPGWDERLRSLVDQKGFKFHAKAGAGSDYSVFRKGLFDDTMPDFSLGKGHWDGWLMYHALDRGCELVDCTDTVFAVHQDHPWRVWRGEGSQRNLKLTGGNMRWVFDATRRLA